jgi:cell division protease FtsH
MGGRVAEEQIFGYEKVTAGAASDIQQATKIARYMVTQWGMSDSLGPIGYDENQQEVFLGHSVTQSKNVSEATAQQIASEIRRIVEEGYHLAQETLREKADDLEALAQGLLEHESLSGEEITAILRGEPMPKPKKAAEHPPKSTATPGGKRGSVPTTRPPTKAPPATRTPARRLRKDVGRMILPTPTRTLGRCS